MDKSHREEIERLLGGWPVVDARKPFRFVVNEDDVKKADPKSPKTCAIAMSVRRFTGSPAVAVYHRFAYIPFDKKGDGKMVIERFMPSLRTRHAIESFDRTGVFPPGEYQMNPPSESARFNARRKYQQQKRKERNRDQEIKGEAHIAAAKESRRSVKMLGVRNGRGLVQFKKKK